MRLAAFVAVLLCTIPAAHAVDAVTYKGTLGGLDIVLELTDGGSGAAVGRYSYMNKGGDIPLNALDAAGGGIALSEEAPCTATTCIAGDDGEITDKPVGATWSLLPGADGKLTGTWTPAGKGKTLDIALSEIARRTLSDDTAATPYGLYDSVMSLSYSDVAGFTAEAAPYEFAKMDVALTEGPVETLEGSTYRYVTDPRTKFAFPRIVALADGSSPDAANAALAQRHMQVNYGAFNCLGLVYGGFGGRGDFVGMGAGTLGDYDAEMVTMAYLSPTLVGWTEGGSTFCQGAYPNNHFDSYIVNANSGAPFALGRVFKDWTATMNYRDYDAEVDQDEALADPLNYGWQAGEPLVDFVRTARTPDADAEFEAECGIDDLIGTNLGIRFAPGDQVIFSLADLPHVSFACGSDLLTVNLADIPQLLTPGAGHYFPALGKTR